MYNVYISLKNKIEIRSDDDDNKYKFSISTLRLKAVVNVLNFLYFRYSRP